MDADPVNFPHGETVTVLTAGTVTDPYSTTPSESWELPEGGTWATEPGEVEVPGVAVEPRPSGEPNQDARNATTSGFTLYLPPETAVTAQSRVTVRGVTYNVIGEPAEWRNPFSGWQPGIVIQVERTEG